MSQYYWNNVRKPPKFFGGLKAILAVAMTEGPLIELMTDIVVVTVFVSATLLALFRESLLNVNLE
jgi:hypothetical protein